MIPEYKLAIEIDGALHYYQRTLNIKANNLFKYRLYDKIGLNYITIDHLKYYPMEVLLPALIEETVDAAIERSKDKIDQMPEVNNIYANVIKGDDGKQKAYEWTN